MFAPLRPTKQEDTESETMLRQAPECSPPHRGERTGPATTRGIRPTPHKTGSADTACKL